jgi:hypothetical protein
MRKTIQLFLLVLTFPALLGGCSQPSEISRLPRDWHIGGLTQNVTVGTWNLGMDSDRLAMVATLLKDTKWKGELSESDFEELYWVSRLLIENIDFEIEDSALSDEVQVRSIALEYINYSPLYWKP